MALFRSSSTRRREVRKALPKQGWAAWRAINRLEVIWGVGLVLVFIALSGLIIIDNRSQPLPRPGQLVDRTRIARVPFQAIDRVKTEENRRRAAEMEPAVYVINETFLAGTRERLKTLPVVAATVDYQHLAEDLQKSFALSREAHEALKPFQAEGQPSDAWVRRIGRLTDALKQQAILLDTERYQAEKQNVSPTIRIVGVSPPASDRDAYNVGDEAEVRRALAPYLEGLPRPVADTLVGYFVRAREPTHRFDARQTSQAKLAAAENQRPAQSRYERNSVLVPAGEELTTDGYDLLGRERDEYLASVPGWARLMYYVGPLMLLAVVVCAMALGVVTLRPRIVQNPMRGLALVGLLLAELLLAWAARPMNPYATPAAVVGPTVLVAVIVATAYDPRLAAAVSTLLAVLTCLALGQGLSLYVVTVLACLAAVLQLAEVRRRGRLIRMGFVTGILTALGVLVVGLSDRQYVPPDDHAPGTLGVVFAEALTAGVATVAVGFFVLGALPFIERAFKVTTSMTLLELADMDHPLLRRLAQAAPGTFNHSLQVAALAEAGAEAIGANGLLARVGAYYHDIGKIHKPGYFVENQTGGTNRHEKLSPAMSLLIIVAHVKDGIEMAREYALPSSLIHFIESHHGTTLVEYFYHAAKRSRDERQQPDEVEFRYPGPRPQTREAAVVMICDAAESACRALADPTPTRIEQLVQKLTSKRLLDGQFDECEITLNELRQVEEAVTKTLASIYHGRVAYPGEKRIDKVELRTQPAIEERVAG